MKIEQKFKKSTKKKYLYLNKVCIKNKISWNYYNRNCQYYTKSLKLCKNFKIYKIEEKKVFKII